MLDIEHAPSQARHNSVEIANATICGCYQCKSIFSAGAVKTFIDDKRTALCPRCGIDSVLPNITDTDDLVKLHQRWFETVGASANPI